jgi:recombination protein RecT
MSTNAVRTAAGAANTEAKSFPAMLEAHKKQIALALPRHLNADRMARIALTAFRGNPKLGDCKPASVFAAVIMGSQLGLEPGIMGQAFLVPYKDECQFIPGWQGYVDLISRAGRASVWTGAVYEGDEFDYGLGDRPFITHKENPNGDRELAKLTHCYAVGRVKGAEWPIIEVWSKRRLEKHRDKYNKVGNRHYSFNNFEMYGRKVPLLQVIKYMPKSVEMNTLAELDSAAELGSQGLDTKSVLEGSWAPVHVPSEEGGSQPSGNGGDVPHFDEASAIDAIKAAKTPAELETTWNEIFRDYGARGGVPLAVEAARNDRREALK